MLYVNPSCPMYRKPNWKAYRQSIEPGAFLWSMSEPRGFAPYRVLWLRLPNGSECSLPIAPIDPAYLAKFAGRFASWVYDANTPLGAPTITPSIRHGRPGDKYYWHGYVTAGKLVGCEENL
jgi:hypothetical protein